LERSTVSAASSRIVNAGSDTCGRSSGARSLAQISSSDRKPMSEKANATKGMIAEKTWNEIALA